MSTKSVYRVIFHNQGKVYEIYARRISQGTLFGERTAVVVDPSEERLKKEFSGVKRSHIPIQAVIRIDEVEKEGIAKISADDGGKVTPFPSPLYPPTQS